MYIHMNWHTVQLILTLGCDVGYLSCQHHFDKEVEWQKLIVKWNGTYIRKYMIDIACSIISGSVLTIL